jgi:D-glycero-alpha-D-manno-heptose-7-phosphate kinase
MTTIEATAPTRIDLAGGTLDIWPLYLYYPGAMTLNVALDRRASCRMTTGVNGVILESKDGLVKAEGRDLSELIAKGSLPLIAHILRALGLESGVHVITQARVPAGSGLGVSSAVAVAVAAAAAEAMGKPLDPESLCRVVRDAEAQSSGVPAGVQDCYAALRGGVLEIRLAAGNVTAQRLATDPSRVEEHLLLADAGATRLSGINNWDVFKRQIDGDPGVREALAHITSTAQHLRAALVDQRYDDVPSLIRDEWAARKRLTAAVTTPEIDRIVGLAEAAGGAAKACGAGGGGMVAIWVSPDARDRLLKALGDTGVKAFPIRVDLQGLSVEKT